VATEAAWLDGNNLEKEEERKRGKTTNKLATHRPSHGRRWAKLLDQEPVQVRNSRAIAVFRFREDFHVLGLYG